MVYSADRSKAVVPMLVNALLLCGLFNEAICFKSCLVLYCYFVLVIVALPGLFSYPFRLYCHYCSLSLFWCLGRLCFVLVTFSAYLHLFLSLLDVIRSSELIYELKTAVT